MSNTDNEAHARGMATIAKIIGWDGDGDPVEYAKAYAQQASGYESDAWSLGNDRDRIADALGLPHDVSSDELVAGVVASASTTRTTSALLRIDHILRGYGDYQTEAPWPTGASVEPVVMRAQVVMAGLNAASTALAEARKIKA